MEWQTYSRNLRKVALREKYTQEEIDRFINYADNLFGRNLPVVFEPKHLSLLVGYELSYLQSAVHSTHQFYRTFTIPKKSSKGITRQTSEPRAKLREGQKRSAGEKVRKISEPLPSLKEIQHWILREILEKCSVSKYAKAYVRERSIKENARFHINQKIVLTIDIEDFFGSIKTDKVLRFFRKLGYSKSVATMLAQLCTLNNTLPQGAPTSPAISNILMSQIDERIGGFTKEHKIRYTRYSDDMTFSGDFSPGMIIKFVTEVLIEDGFSINPLKTRTRRTYQQQEVTGIVVNKQLHAPRKLRRQLRQAVYYLEKYGLANHLHHTKNDKANYIPHLLGIANFILFIDPSDSETKEYSAILKSYLPPRH